MPVEWRTRVLIPFGVLALLAVGWLAILLCSLMLCGDYTPLYIDKLNHGTAQKTEKSRRELKTERFVVSFSEMLLFSNQLPSARFEAIMTNFDAQKESCSAQFGSFDYMFYYYFNKPRA
jgi:hypothetical protein